ncbi:MAG: hypothetical protein AAF585_05695 [Verrucomicrobiota bacterium]
MFFAIEWVLHRCQQLPVSVFEGSSIFVGALTSSWAFVLMILASIGVVVCSPRWKWKRDPLRWVTWIIVGILAWYAATTHFNFHYQQAFWIDRALILGLAIAAWFHPGFLAAFLALIYAWIAQLNLPLQNSWTDKLIVLHVGLAVFVWIAAEPFLNRRAGPILICAVIGGFYLAPALGKLQIGWLVSNDLSNLVRSAFLQNGWQSVLSPEFVEKYNPAILTFSLIAELAVLLFLTNRKICVAVLASLIALHVGIFLTSGIFFWKWIVLDAAMIWYVLRLPGKTFQRQTWILCLASMTVLAALSLRVPMLAWYDSPMSYQFRFEATGESGRRYELLADDFAPYDLHFAQARFYFTTNHPQVVDTFGTTKHAGTLKALENSKEAPIEATVVRYSELQRQEFERFLQNWMSHQKPRLPIHPPNHIHTKPRPFVQAPRFDGSEPIQSIEIYLTEWIGFEKVHESKVQTIQR